MNVDRAAGRVRISVEVETSTGRTQVVPADSAQLMAEEQLDARLDVTVRAKPAHRKAHRTAAWAGSVQ
ncbi:hypothetical protein [Streptomyces sp. N35]|uniref:hypothetical protein n=1 Tax=Streptomyces sp. N35 TaxID=2795730 RepID=UPI0018F58F2A|nr:hypothetical protein [Streptomyces sp. N35]